MIFNTRGIHIYDFFLVNPYASSSNDTSAGRSINQESAYTQPNGVVAQTTASSQKYIPSLSNNVKSRVVFNGNINSTTNSRQVNILVAHKNH